MKKILFVSTAILLFLVSITSCKKNNAKPSPKLATVKVVNTSNDSFRYDYYYDVQGKLTKITMENRGVVVTAYDIIYSGNEIILAKPATSLPDRHLTDTTYLFTDVNGSVTKRIYHTATEFLSPNIPDREWHMDTTSYTYSNEGVLNSAAFSAFDTIWQNNGTTNTSARLAQFTVSYTNSAGNLSQSFELGKTHQVVRTSGTTNVFDNTYEWTKTYDYSQSNPNKTDFTNSSIKNESNWIADMPFNMNYKNLPNRLITLIVTKDANGTVISSDTIEVDYQFTYNADGLVSTRTGSDALGKVISFFYD